MLPPLCTGRGELNQVLIHPARMHAAGPEVLVGEDVLEEPDVGVDAIEPELG